jgi:spore germination cell wall hydrolase CwlJ-like protein
MTSAKILLAYLLQTADVSGLNIDTSQIDPEQAYCLAENIYYESRNEDIRGQIAVASVTVNRAKDPRFPGTICEVVKFTAPSKITNKPVCAFSWYCENDKKGKTIIIKNDHIREQFETAAKIAIEVLAGSIEDNTQGATHFHNPFTSFPTWRLQMKKTMVIGNHAFYRMPEPKN